MGMGAAGVALAGRAEPRVAWSWRAGVHAAHLMMRSARESWCSWRPSTDSSVPHTRTTLPLSSVTVCSRLPTPHDAPCAPRPAPHEHNTSCALQVFFASSYP